MVDAPTPPPVQQGYARSAGGRAGAEGLRRLRTISLVVPAAFLITILLVRARLVEVLPRGHGHVLIDAALVVGTIMFSLLLFSSVDVEYRRIVVENRDLIAVDAVVAAVRRGVSVDEVVRASMDAILRIGPARTVTVRARTGVDGLDGLEGTDAAEDEWSAVGAGQGGRSFAVPLMSGPIVLGALIVEGAGRDAPSEEAYAEIGQVVGGALQRARYTELLQEECYRASHAERERITREMHDSLAQVLGAAHFRLLGLVDRPELTDVPDIRAELNDIAVTCDEAYGDVREAILGLRENNRVERPFEQALASYVEAFDRRTGIMTSLSASEDAPQLPAHQRTQAFRIVQEALTNVRKHSGATAAVVSVRHEERGLAIVVADDGRGFDPRRVHESRFGLSTMRERAELIDGSLRVHSTPGAGTRVELLVPVPVRLSA